MKLSFPHILLFSAICAASSFVPAYAAPGDTPVADDSMMQAQKHAADDVSITDAWMALAGPARNVGAVYFTIANAGETAHLLSGVSSPSCSATGGYHIDQHLTEDLKTLFTHLALPSKSTLVFPPGGYHLICLNPDPSLKPGQTTKFTFHFLGGTEKTVPVLMKDS